MPCESSACLLLVALSTLMFHVLARCVPKKFKKIVSVICRILLVDAELFKPEKFFAIIGIIH